MIVAQGFRWIAETRDHGTAHAHALRGRPTRTLCGEPARSEQHASAIAVRCDRCQRVVDGAPNR